MALRRIEGRRPVINTVGGARGRCALHKSRGELLPTERHSAELLVGGRGVGRAFISLRTSSSKTQLRLCMRLNFRIFNAQLTQ
jgi:hypothetical protein